jgi:hypothetical protein
MTEITQEHIYTHITMIELYNIIDTYKKSYKLSMIGHDKCLCKKHFKDHDNKNSFTDYLLSHYEKMNKLDIIIDTLKKHHPNTAWNPNHGINCIGNNNFKLQSKCALIGYNDKNTILCYIKPELNKLNFNEIKTKSILDTFILIHDTRENNYNKYNGKKIIICIISLNLDEPYYIDFGEINDIKEIINKAMFGYYSIKNKDVFRFYKYYKHQGLTIVKITKKYDEIDDTLFENTKNRNAHYITQFFHNIRDEYADCEDRTEFITDLELNFMDKINKALQDSIDLWLESLK